MGAHRQNRSCARAARAATAAPSPVEVSLTQRGGTGPPAALGGDLHTSEKRTDDPDGETTVWAAAAGAMPGLGVTARAEGWRAGETRGENRG